LPLRGVSFAPGVRGRSGLARPRSRRAETPEATTQQCGPARGPSVSAKGRVPDTPPRIRTLGTPWPPETGPPHPPGGIPRPPEARPLRIGAKLARDPHAQARWLLWPSGRIECPRPARAYTSSNPVALRPSAARPKDPVVPGRRFGYPTPQNRTLTANQERPRIRPAIKRPRAGPCRADCRLGDLYGA